MKGLVGVGGDGFLSSSQLLLVYYLLVDYENFEAELLTV
jgi:hypothetical protein